VVKEGQLIGLVSRADILRAVIAGSQEHPVAEDHEIRERIVELLRQQTEVYIGSMKIMVANGDVYLRGTVGSQEDADAIRAAAESVVGVNKVHNLLSV